MARPLREGGGVGKGRAIKEKITFLAPFFQRSNVPAAFKLKGCGAF